MNIQDFQKEAFATGYHLYYIEKRAAAGDQEAINFLNESMKYAGMVAEDPAMMAGPSPEEAAMMGGAPEAQIQCPSCGNVVTPSPEGICPVCGFDFNAMAETAAAPVGPEAAPMAAPGAPSEGPMLKTASYLPSENQYYNVANYYKEAALNDEGVMEWLIQNYGNRI